MQRTDNYDLPIYEVGDNPKWTDLNEAMQTIDSNLGGGSGESNIGYFEDGTPYIKLTGGGKYPLINKPEGNEMQTIGVETLEGGIQLIYVLVKREIAPGETQIEKLYIPRGINVTSIGLDETTPYMNVVIDGHPLTVELAKKYDLENINASVAEAKRDARAAQSDASAALEAAENTIKSTEVSRITVYDNEGFDVVELDAPDGTTTPVVCGIIPGTGVSLDLTYGNSYPTLNVESSGGKDDRIGDFIEFIGKSDSNKNIRVMDSNYMNHYLIETQTNVRSLDAYLNTEGEVSAIEMQTEDANGVTKSIYLSTLDTDLHGFTIDNNTDRVQVSSPNYDQTYAFMQAFNDVKGVVNYDKQVSVELTNNESIPLQNQLVAGDGISIDNTIPKSPVINASDVGKSKVLEVVYTGESGQVGNYLDLTPVGEALTPYKNLDTNKAYFYTFELINTRSEAESFGNVKSMYTGTRRFSNISEFSIPESLFTFSVQHTWSFVTYGDLFYVRVTLEEIL